jgi:hypothetical protein
MKETDEDLLNFPTCLRSSVHGYQRICWKTNRTSEQVRIQEGGRDAIKCYTAPTLLHLAFIEDKHDKDQSGEVTANDNIDDDHYDDSRHLLDTPHIFKR